MTKKLIFIDLDGTLLNDSFELSPYTLRTLKEVSRKGHRIVLASGRPPRAILPYYEELGLTTPFIAYNGTYVTDPNDPSFPSLKKAFPLKDVKDILSKIDFPLLNIAFEDEEKAYAKIIDPFLLAYFPKVGEKIMTGDANEHLTKDVFALIFETEEEYDERLKEIVESHVPMGCRHWSGSKHCEAYYAHYDKGNAAKYIADYYGVEPKDIIAFGDSDSDYKMLSLAGEKYCVFPCKSRLLLEKFPSLEKGNNDDAVAHKLEELLLN
ncbi:MAG: Cof-type HAD-IIB family hydrolase [Bacilli bacterium]|nr:Cof-type HAD-IIB family hydrolase [Bacilli bacterium]